MVTTIEELLQEEQPRNNAPTRPGSLRFLFDPDLLPNLPNDDDEDERRPNDDDNKSLLSGDTCASDTSQDVPFFEFRKLERDELVAYDKQRPLFLPDKYNEFEHKFCQFRGKDGETYDIYHDFNHWLAVHIPTDPRGRIPPKPVCLGNTWDYLHCPSYDHRDSLPPRYQRFRHLIYEKPLIHWDEFFEDFTADSVKDPFIVKYDETRANLVVRLIDGDQSTILPFAEPEETRKRTRES